MQRPLPDNTQQSQATNIHAPGGIQTHNPRKRGAADRAVTRNVKRQYHYLRQTTTTEPWSQHFYPASQSLCIRQSVSIRVCKQLHYTGLSSTRTPVGSRVCSFCSPPWKFTLSAKLLKNRAYILTTVEKFWLFTLLLSLQITHLRAWPLLSVVHTYSVRNNGTSAVTPRVNVQLDTMTPYWLVTIDYHCFRR